MSRRKHFQASGLHVYGKEHKRRRKELMPAALGTMCPVAGPHCDGLMFVPRRMHLDHSTPVALGGMVGDRIVCMPCNCGMGATLGNELRKLRINAYVWDGVTQSREW